MKISSLLVERVRICIATPSLIFQYIGAGKSFVIQLLIKYVLPKPPYSWLTASTGIAAVAFNGCTVHSAAHIGLGQEPAVVLIQKIKSQKNWFKDWKRVQVIVIDEISMIEADLLDKLYVIGQAIRGNNQPFGGIQVILSGDFWQLPAVRDGAKFAFEGVAWKNTISTMIELTKVFRQKNPEFLEVLEEVKYPPAKGVSQKTIQFLRKLQRPLPPRNGIKPTILYPTNKMVDDENAKALAALPGDMWIIESIDHYPKDKPEFKKRLDNVVMAPCELKIKLNTQVMHLKNAQGESGLVNGTRGIVTKVSMPSSGVKYMMMEDFLKVTPGKEKEGKWLPYKAPAPLIVTVPITTGVGSQGNKNEANLWRI